MTKKKRYRLRLISAELKEDVWSKLAAHEGLTPKDGYVEWQLDDYSEMGNEVLDYLGGEGTLVLGWDEDPEDTIASGDVWSQVDQIIRDLMGDWEKARFQIVYHTDEPEIRIQFEVLE